MTLDDYFPFRDLPWLRPLLAYSLAALGLWILAALLASLLLPVIVRAQEGLGGLITRLTAWVREQQQRRRDRAAARRALAARTRLRSAVSGDTLADATQAVRTLEGAVRQNFEHVIRAAHDVGATVRGLVPAGPAPAADPMAFIRTRKGRMNLVFSSVLLLCFATVNMFMLSEILKDLGIVPPNLRFGPLELRFVFAFILTLAEAGVGYLYGYFSEADDVPDGDERQFRLAPLLIGLGAMVIAGVEGAFYAAVGGDRGNIPVLGVPYAAVFFAWGFVLVMTLFGLGVVWHRSSTDATTRSGAFAVRKGLDRLGARADACRRELESTEKERLKVEQGLTSLAARLATAAPEPGDVTPAKGEDLGPLEVRTVVVAVLTAILVVAFFAIWRQLLEALYRLPDWQFHLAAAGHTAAFLMAGMLMSSDAVVRRGRRGSVLAVVCLVIAVAGYLAVGYRAWQTGGGQLWLLSMSMAIVLVFAGRELSPLLWLLPLELTLLGHALLSLVSHIPIWISRLVWLVLGVVRFVFEMLRAPFWWRPGADVRVG
jgi:hypothetical protein